MKIQFVFDHNSILATFLIFILIIILVFACSGDAVAMPGPDDEITPRLTSIPELIYIEETVIEPGWHSVYPESVPTWTPPPPSPEYPEPLPYPYPYPYPYPEQ